MTHSTGRRPTSTPSTMDYTTQGDLNQVPPVYINMAQATTQNQFFCTTNIFILDGSNRHIHEVFHAGHLENENNAYLLELPGLKGMLHTSKFIMDEVLTQSHTTVIDGKSTTTDHPVTFVSGLFRGSQLTWATLTKEGFAIYMSVKKLSFYLTDATILFRSDHKPLEKFLQKNTLNSKVNNWAMELEAFNIQFDYIKGSSNVLADTLSHLIVIDPDTSLTPEGQGYEFGYAIFEEFPEVKTNTYDVNEVIVGTKKEIKNDPDLQDTLQCIENPITP